MWKCPGCDKDFGSWGDKAPCVIPECKHIMCRDCCEKRSKCAVCANPYVNPKNDCRCGAEKYFQPDHNALRLLDEARAMRTMLAEQVLTQDMVASWTGGSGRETHGDTTPFSVRVRIHTGETLKLDGLLKSDPFSRIMLMVQERTGIQVDQQRFLYRGKILEPTGHLGRPVSLSALEIADGSATIDMVLRMRGC